MLPLVLALGFVPTPSIRCQARLPRLRYASARLAGEPGTDGAAGEDAESPGALRLEQSRLAAIEAYSWSVSRLSTSQDGVRDAYAWSIAVASNASAAVGRAVVGLRVSQFPALLPKWLTSRATREAAAPLAPPDDGDAAPRRYIETLVGANDRLYAGMLLFVSCLEMMGPLALLLVARAVTARRVAALPGVRRAALSLWVCGEAAFYVACLAVAMRENLRLGGSACPPPFAAVKTREWRRGIWRRILRDPSQSPRDFVEGWMFRRSELADASPAELLLKAGRASEGGASEGGAAGEAGGGSGLGPGSGRPRLEPYGVVWEDLSRADLENWLCRSLFGKQRPRLLSSDEARHALDKRHLPDAS